MNLPSADGIIIPTSDEGRKLRAVKQLAKVQTSIEKAVLEFESRSANIAFSCREGGREGRTERRERGKEGRREREREEGKGGRLLMV